MQNKSYQKKMAVTAVAAILLVILYILIFTFSEQDGERSGSLSYKISMICTEILNQLSGKNMTQLRMEALAKYFEHPIRKLAHFAEYTIMGTLISTMLLTWKKKRFAPLFTVNLIWVFCSAAVDEAHQLLIPGRCGNFADVCLDSAGGCFGFLLMYLLFYRFLEWLYFGRTKPEKPAASASARE